MKSTSQVLRQPIRIFVLTSVGLTAALVSDGVGDYVGWACLGGIVGIAVRCSFAGWRR